MYKISCVVLFFFFFFQAEDGIRDKLVTGVQTCALPIFGKTEVAKVMARMLGTNLIRLQCYEGLDASTALYEWNYQKQLLHIKLEEAGHNNRSMEIGRAHV